MTSSRVKWKEFNRWWNAKREQYGSVWGDAATLTQSIDDKLRELQGGKK